MTATIRGRVFAAPGPGAWELDAVHMSRPLTRYVGELISEPFAQGFSEGTAKYGLTLDCFRPALVHGVWYHRAEPFGAPKGATRPPPKLLFQLLTRLHPAMRRRFATAKRAVEGRVWRDDLRLWDEVVKPASNAQHLRLQQSSPQAMTDGELSAHLAACRDQLGRMVKQHHQFTAGSIIATGDYLAHAQEWTGLTTGELLRPLRGSSPVSRGVAAPELDALALALRDDSPAREALDAGKASDVLVALRQLPGRTGEAARAWLDVVSWRSVGYDVCDAVAIELPDVLVGSVRSALAADTDEQAARDEIARHEAHVRDAVPSGHRATFDEMLGDARAVNRLRDERGNYSDSWATGLARRALLAAGERLAASSRLEDASLVLDATNDEVTAMLRGEPGPSNEELRAHREWRTTMVASEAPAWLGAQPAGPPPVEWLPPHARRAARAMGAAIGALFDEPEAKVEGAILSGLAVSPGVYEGPARLVTDSHDFARLQRGDVLVTRATSATFNVVLPLLGAIVTDRGGQLCHAAIVARENGIPGVVGTREATTRIRDGMRVRVDGTNGVVTLLS